VTVAGRDSSHSFLFAFTIYGELQYKIDNIPVKEFEIKFLATLENGEKIDLTFPNGAGLTWESIFGKDGNLPLSAIEEDAELVRWGNPTDETQEEKK
tara:strand:+ start:195 stop:485 length:291 start_codon:yes stop_codon:yes gene_type:complete